MTEAPTREESGTAGSITVPVGAEVGGAVGGPCPPEAAPPILDIPTQRKAIARRLLSSRCRRLFSRAILGVLLPGMYYFVTLTSSPQSPPIARSWRGLRRWFRKYRPLTEYIYVMTDEGYGVIHMIIRLGPREKRIEIKELRAYWKVHHIAVQIRIRPVTTSDREQLVKYISDQRKRRGLAGEMAWQDTMVKWRPSRRWLPKAFGRSFGRFWWYNREKPVHIRESEIHDWLLRCLENPDEVQDIPVIHVVGEHPDRLARVAACEHLVTRNS